MEFQGSLDELKTLVMQLQIPCHWQHKGCYELAVFEDGVSNLKLNWWPETGSIQLVGDPEVRIDAANRLKQLLEQR
ncbi:MAG: hypothetical protein VKO19_00220 [Cyanobacteriota bacterium]|nr:hypothetical protein [Cyanobacteriota bacterium]